MLRLMVLSILTLRNVISQQLHLPVLEAIASGRLAPPKGKEGIAVGIFPHLASELRDGDSIYYAKREQQFPANQNQNMHERLEKPLSNSDRVEIASVDVAELQNKVERLRVLVQSRPAAADANAHSDLAQSLQVNGSGKLWRLFGATSTNMPNVYSPIT